MKLWQDYVKEREGAYSIVRPEQGFLSYLMGEGECYIKELYVAPEYRRSGVAASMADEAVEHAKKEGCVVLTGSVDPRAKEAATSMRVLLAYGFSLWENRGNLTILRKDI